MTTGPNSRIGYLISKYPAVSHTFILREVDGLRRLGFDIETASINEAPARETLTMAEQQEADATFYVKREGGAGALSALGWMLLRNPLSLLRGTVFSLKLGASELRSLVYHLFYLVEAVILAKWLHDRSIRHLHVHFATECATVALLLRRISSTTLSITVHGPDEFYDVSGYHLAEKLSAAEFVVCISFFAQSQVMKLTRGTEWPKFEISRLGVDTEIFAPRRLASADNTVEILCVGRLVSSKGQRILIEAVARVLQRGCDCTLCLVGDGPDRGDLEDLVAEKKLASSIRFAGSVNQDQIREYYDRAEIFALASFAEGIPVVLMEAMAMEIPCVTTSINGIPELIRDGVDGVLVAPSDVEGLADALCRLICEPELRRSLGRDGRRRVQECYELSRSVERLADVFTRRLELAR